MGKYYNGLVQYLPNEEEEHLITWFVRWGFLFMDLLIFGVLLS